ncbi:YibE/F family protein [Tepidibacter hydrothermalis]|uniref:YibE/F family protein n=1 Tax=Tepidibacter hydrothermalis TaxID=3036126 RepID=A0ABY8EIQ8_9FIRM|nr:YibE/F family protein [Tepidibacter hydrothermalis]WFD10830.1 YibE/F family protein [Tepidibacter hydrothermalis]
MKKIIFALIFIMFLPNIVFAQNIDDNDIVKAQVLDVKTIDSDGVKKEIVKVKVLEGEYLDKEIDIEYLPIKYSQYSFDLHKGSKVRIKLEKDNGELKANIMNVSREDNLKLLAIIFLISVILFGKIRGILSITSLAVSGFIIIKFMIPFILKGYNPLLISIICSIFIVLISFILVSGFTYKSFAAMLGTICGTISAGVLAYVFTDLCSITGLADEDVQFLITSMNITLDFRGFFMSGVIIGTIGAVMDVAMTVTSVIFEVKSKSRNLGFIKLIGTGLNVGKDVMATMVNTLILAYAGASMPLLIILNQFNISINQIVSMEILSTEIIRSLCGSIGLILTIPLTSVIASVMANNKR